MIKENEDICCNYIFRAGNKKNICTYFFGGGSNTYVFDPRTSCKCLSLTISFNCLKHARKSLFDLRSFDNFFNRAHLYNNFYRENEMYFFLNFFEKKFFRCIHKELFRQINT